MARLAFAVDAEGRLLRARVAPRRQGFDRTLFAEDLASLLQAGLTLHEALGIMAGGMPRAQDRQCLRELQLRIVAGSPVSQALDADAMAFGPVLVALVRASEQSSGLAHSLARYAADERRAQAARSQVVSALVYPALLLVVGVAVAAFLMGWVVPRFAEVIAQQGAGLSSTARLLLQAGTVLGQTRGLWLGALLVLAVGAGLQLSRPAGRQRVQAWATRLPGLRSTLRLVHASRFFSTAGTLTSAGLPAPQALELAAPLLMPDGRLHVQQALLQLRAGRALASSLDSAVFGDAVVGRLLEVGQRTGALPATLERITVLLEARAQRRLQRLVRAFEPILMVLLGLLVGGVVLLMYVPLLELSAAVQ